MVFFADVLSSYCLIFHLVGLLLILYGFHFWFYEFCFQCVSCGFFSPLAYHHHHHYLFVCFFSSVSFPKREKGRARSYVGGEMRMISEELGKGNHRQDTVYEKTVFNKGKKT